MKELTFTGNSITEWQNFKDFYREIFWEELKRKNNQMLKQTIETHCEKVFEMQIRAKKYERNGVRRGERLGKRYRSLETEFGIINNIKLLRAKGCDIRFTLFDKWQRIQPSVIKYMLKVYLMSKSSAKASKIMQELGHSKYSRGFYVSLSKYMEKGLKEWLDRPITKKYKYVFIDGMGVSL
ncbi:MAG: transposase, partial [Candidatus Omnitrophica bacterium]|nr:transposase [Candidatus Omnitrophota bacterium]